MESEFERPRRFRITGVKPDGNRVFLLQGLNYDQASRFHAEFREMETEFVAFDIEPDEP